MARRPANEDGTVGAGKHRRITLTRVEKETVDAFPFTLQDHGPGHPRRVATTCGPGSTPQNCETRGSRRGGDGRALLGEVAGLVPGTVVAVPTSTGYGTAFGGVTALLTVLNSCAPGVAVVNVDNGYGAGHLAPRSRPAVIVRRPPGRRTGGGRGAVQPFSPPAGGLPTSWRWKTM